MRIAFVITRSDEIGGAHIHVRDLAKWLQDQGHEVCVFVGGDDIFSEELRGNAVPVSELKHMKRPISPLNDLFAIQELERRLKNFSPEIVAAHSAKAGMITRIACFKAKIPCVYTAHGWSYIAGSKGVSKQIFRTLERVLAPLSGRIVTVCKADFDFALTEKICSREKITTIHNGMPAVDSESIDSSSVPNADSPTIIMVARFEEPKDHETLIKALSDLKDLPWNLQLVGDGPLTDQVKAMVAKHALDERVYFLGRRQDIAALLANAEIFTLISDAEGFPMSILEAMRAGLPVISTNVGGTKESVIDRETGYVINPRDHVTLSARLRELLESPELRRKLGRKGLLLFENEFTFENMASTTLALYQEILSESADMKKAWSKN